MSQPLHINQLSLPKSYSVTWNVRGTQLDGTLKVLYSDDNFDQVVTYLKNRTGHNLECSRLVVDDSTQSAKIELSILQDKIIPPDYKNYPFCIFKVNIYDRHSDLAKTVKLSVKQIDITAKIIVQSKDYAIIKFNKHIKI